MMPKASDHDFIFTKKGANGQHITAFRTPPPNTSLCRWVRCHVIGNEIVLGDIRNQSEQDND